MLQLRDRAERSDPSNVAWETLMNDEAGKGPARPAVIAGVATGLAAGLAAGASAARR
jgi:hypothetical protein